MTMTLSNVFALESDPLTKYIISNILRDVSLMEKIPFMSVNGLKVVSPRLESLPDVDFRRVNTGYTASEGNFGQVWETLYPLGGEIRFDRVFKLAKNFITDPVKAQIDAKTKAMAITFNDYFINGDHATDPDGFEGLKKRVSNMPARQTVYFAGSTSAALDPTASTANARAFLDKLEEMHYKCNGGNVSAWIVNEGLRYGIGRVLRYIQISGGNILSTTQDTFGREIPTLYGAPIIDIGLKKDQSTEIITNTEVGGDSTANATSIYAVSFDTREGLVGIQLEPMKVYDPLGGKEMEDVPANMIRIEWWLGLATFSNYSIVRGRNLEGAPNWS